MRPVVHQKRSGMKVCYTYLRVAVLLCLWLGMVVLSADALVVVNFDTNSHSVYVSDNLGNVFDVPLGPSMTFECSGASSNNVNWNYDSDVSDDYLVWAAPQGGSPGWCYVQGQSYVLSAMYGAGTGMVFMAPIAVIWLVRRGIKFSFGGGSE